MNGSNRRNFIKTAGASAAAAGAVALIPAVTAGSEQSAPVAPAAAPAAAPKLPAAAKGAMVAYIDDVSTGEVTVMVEGREVTVTNHQLVAQLAHALHSQTQV